MVDGKALGVQATDSRARILTLVADAGLVRRAVRAKHALRSAALVGVALVLVDALACSGSVPLDAVGVRSARRRLAWLHRLLLLGHTLHKRIAGESWRAGAGHSVSDNSALGVGAAGSRAGVATLVVDTCLGGLAIRIDDALGPAVGRRTEELRLALADWTALVGLANGVGSAGRG